MKAPSTATLARGATPRERGVVLLVLLLALALGGIALMAAADVWSLARQRAQEQELLFVGEQYRQAIQRYYFAAPPGASRTLPLGLQDLLEDDRYPVPVRHLRRLYPDPITGGGEWGLLRVGERIAGIYSLSDKEPIKRAGFPPGYQHFSDRAAYRDWVFAISPSGQPLIVMPPSLAEPGNGFDPSVPPRPVRREPS
jgi:type II secretory pathway pseudopilin PulG